ncbi:hypothetical protein Tco_0683009 [Tanacetum coccineum]|uniref:Uncharacterized protein n=1 Tax=Tanacetum coccineum TaxID=301880 RepID=A0ABQ4XT06_9ASTR
MTYLERLRPLEQNKYCRLKRVKKLERKKRSRSYRMKRLYKVGLTAKIESSNEDLGEDASKQRRISLTNCYAKLKVSVAGVQVSAAGAAKNCRRCCSNKLTTTANNVEEILLAQAL